MHTFILTADSCCCIAEINTTLSSNYLPINFFNFNKVVKKTDLKPSQRKEKKPASVW